mmetsp:Transcript_20143/g.27204  ORF Transcript_20143/g.27204 Transcript_20143/m.27204 type:complete len:106 (-) Transcript_20143:2376-2693(-)|eukprot:CAMPEP_0185576278 /NCGR_PEP_ID=MMETSP0434-20130131/7237_1 /TAXON_ID=626734 ORGANISM="Favella taraikaensis, Strain Fe Narragansett Bay" /NCGR_SAMPLE_ID=MMETSP0434 /ASSEMBLY_ACC=CAM_ASM_000379 /LENGTH=105 /DNA_ID=CAMNT_0028193413 /DNA_START=910 /DNA_END=1227 /DNA_ORIENTATION=-
MSAWALTTVNGLSLLLLVRGGGNVPSTSQDVSKTAYLIARTPLIEAALLSLLLLAVAVMVIAGEVGVAVHLWGENAALCPVCVTEFRWFVSITQSRNQIFLQVLA